MFFIAGIATSDNKYHWQIMDYGTRDYEEGITINFRYNRWGTLRYFLKRINESLQVSGVEWLYLVNKDWFVDLDKLKNETPILKDVDYLKGKIKVEPEAERGESMVFGILRKETIISFVASKGEIMESVSMKIFLSHKGINKDIVRNYKGTLESLGFDPWLDEDAMPAGSNLDRAILQGFKDSCAVVFFITSEFKDERYLATEVDYAIAQKREKGSKFSIITLVLAGKGGMTNVPELLRSYVWKEPTSELEALREIIKALPIQLGEPSFRR